jgi:SAM-dependent methyltransferase
MSRYLADRGVAVSGIDLSPGMVAQAARHNPDLSFAVGSIADLPNPDGSFAAVMLWYSIIHTPPAGQPAILAEARRVVRDDGLLLLAFQAGSGERDVAPSYRRFGHEIELVRYPATPDEVAGWLVGTGWREVRRAVRPAREGERDDQAALLARAQPIGPHPRTYWGTRDRHDR